VARTGPVTTPVAAVKLALKCLVQRHQLLTTELAILDRDLDRLVVAAAPTLRTARSGEWSSFVSPP